MNNSAVSVDSYLAALPDERMQAMTTLREVIVKNLPDGFEEVMAGMPSYVVPLATFPAGYHCTPNTPLPFLGIASQKNYIALHHFGRCRPGITALVCQRVPASRRQQTGYGQELCTIQKDRPDPIRPHRATRGEALCG
jgi:hypothetical protein